MVFSNVKMANGCLPPIKRSRLILMCFSCLHGKMTYVTPTMRTLLIRYGMQMGQAVYPSTFTVGAKMANGFTRTAR